MVIISDDIIVQTFIIIAFLAVSIWVSMEFFELRLESVLIIFGVFVGISSLIGLIDEYFYSLVIILFIIVAYRLNSARKS